MYLTDLPIGESIHLGAVTIKVFERRGQLIRIAIQAPPSIRVIRAENIRDRGQCGESGAEENRSHLAKHSPPGQNSSSPGLRQMRQS